MRNPIGSHVKVGRGLVSGALATAAEIGAETLQIFAGNPRGWGHSAGDPAVDAEFASRTAEAGIRTFVHAPYLVNLGSPTPQTYQRSVDSVAHHLGRTAAVGAEGLVVHTGSCVDGEDAEASLARAMSQVREGLLPILDALPEDGPWLLLEPTAGQGRSLCATVADLEPYLDALDRHPRVGVCLDTCHAFAAGEPLDEPGGTTDTLDRLVAIAGAGRLRLIHANDSADPRGSMRDRHAQIGSGSLGEQTFTEVLSHPATAGVPLILETPGSGEPGGPCLPMLQKLRDR